MNLGIFWRICLYRWNFRCENSFFKMLWVWCIINLV